MQFLYCVGVSRVDCFRKGIVFNICQWLLNVKLLCFFGWSFVSKCLFEFVIYDKKVALYICIFPCDWLCNMIVFALWKGKFVESLYVLFNGLCVGGSCGL